MVGLQPRSLQGWQEENTSAPVPLGRPIARYLKPPAGKWHFHCMIVAAYRGDGITTTSAQAEQLARRIVGEDAIARLTGADLPRLAITDLLTPRVVVRAAARAGVEPGAPAGRRSWLALVGAALAFGITAAISLLTSATANGTLTAHETYRVLTNQWFIVVAVLTGLGVLVSEPLLHLRSSTTDERLDRITHATATNQASPGARERFVGLLAAALLDDHNRRCLIVEDFARLDGVSQAVIRQALEKIPADRSELWIVFESANLLIDLKPPAPELVGELGRHVLAIRQPSPARAPTAPALRSNAALLFVLKPLTTEQRRQLADDAVSHGQAASSGYTIVKSILSGDVSGPEQDAFKLSWPPDKARADVAVHEALALLYLLSVSAPTGYAVTFPLSRLPAELSADGAHHEVLQLLLNTRPTLDTVRRRLDRALRTFTRFVERDQGTLPTVLRLSPAIQDVLTPRNGAYDLPGVDLVHLFWALYRYDRGSPDRTVWLEPQTRHVREAADPYGVGSPDVARTFGVALLAVIDACVDLGRLADAAALLDRAFDLHAEPGFLLDRAALRKRSRALYAVSINPAVLARAAAGAPFGAAGEHAPDLLIELFEQVTPGVRDLARLRRDDEALSTDLRLRAAWLALALQPLTESVLPRGLSLSRTVVDAHLALPLLTQRALDAADAQLAAADADDWSPAALMSVTTALWCLALADETLTGTIHSRIELGSVSVPRDPALTLSSDEWSQWRSTVDVYLAEGLEHGLYLGRAKPVNEPNYAHAGARSELLVVTVAAAIRIRLTSAGLQRAREKRLDAVILDGCGELGIDIPPAPGTPTARTRTSRTQAKRNKNAASRLLPSTLLTLAERVAKRMSSIEVTWTALGYPRAAAALNTRRVQFLAGLPGDRPQTQAAALGDRARNDLFGLIANLAVADDVTAHASVRAEIVAGTVARLLAAGQLGETLAAQLCFLTIRLGAGYSSVDIGRQLRYLADSPSESGAETRLDAVLADVAEDELDVGYIDLINAANWAASSPYDEGGRAGAVIRALRRRMARVEDPAVVRKLRTRLDMYELMRAVNRGHSPDINATLDVWSDRRTFPGYAFVLYLLARPQNAAIPARLKLEIFAVLHNPLRYLYETGILLLANRMARAQQAQQLTMTPVEAADLIHVLRLGAHQVGRKTALQLPEAIETLRQLFRLDPGNAAHYRAPMLDLQRNTLRLFGEQKLTRLLAEQQYAALLRAYREMFQEFLPVAEGPGNGRVTAFVGGGQHILNAAFLRDLFDPDEQVRARVDVLTRNALIRVLGLLADVPDMPADMADLLRQHRALIQQADVSDVAV